MLWHHLTCKAWLWVVAQPGRLAIPSDKNEIVLCLNEPFVTPIFFQYSNNMGDSTPNIECWWNSPILVTVTHAQRTVKNFNTSVLDFCWANAINVSWVTVKPRYPFNMWRTECVFSKKCLKAKVIGANFLC